MSKKLSRRIYSAATASFLAVLLLIAPCKVRNSIEIALGVQQTTSLNKSKSAKAPICCTTRPKVNIIQCNEESFTIKTIGSFISNDFAEVDFQKVSRFVAEAFLWKDFNTKLISAIPYYILHQNFKVYL